MSIINRTGLSEAKAIASAATATFDFSAKPGTLVHIAAYSNGTLSGEEVVYRVTFDGTTPGVAVGGSATNGFTHCGYGAALGREFKFKDEISTIKITNSSASSCTFCVDVYESNVE